MKHGILNSQKSLVRICLRVKKYDGVAYSDKVLQKEPVNLFERASCHEYNGLDGVMHN